MIEECGIFHITSADEPMDQGSPDISQTPKSRWLLLCVVGLSQVPLGNLEWRNFSPTTEFMSHPSASVVTICTYWGEKKESSCKTVLVLTDNCSSWVGTQVRYFSQWPVPGKCASWIRGAWGWDSAMMSIAYASLADPQYVIDTKVYQVPTKSQHSARDSEGSSTT